MPMNAPTDPLADPLRKLARSSRLVALWSLRILYWGGRPDGLFAASRHLAARTALRLPFVKSDDEEVAWERLDAVRLRLEARSDRLRLPSTLEANLDLLRRQFSFDRVDCAILALAVMLRVDEGLHAVADTSRSCINTPYVLSRILGIPTSRIARALEPGSRLRRSNLVITSSGGDIAMSLQLRRGGLRRLGTTKLKSVDDLFRGMLVASPEAALRPTDYAHLKPGFGDLQRLLRDALDHRRSGVNVLLYGPPGTGKSELARLLAAELGVPMYDVADMDEEGAVLRPEERLAGAVSGLFLLGARRALVCFDEVEAIFNDGSDFFGKPSTAESQKSFFNRLLQGNEVPVFWIANSVRGIDQAFARRFDLVIRLESPPRAQRLRLLERECGSLVKPEQLQQLAQVEQITPAMVTRAASVVRRMRPRDAEGSSQLLETVLDGVLQAQRHPPLKSALRSGAGAGFDPEFCNAGQDLEQLVAGLSQSGRGRLCLYGPPGTGKTAFGHWMAGRLDRPLILKRVSDLQSPWLGEMEQKLAAAFEAAQRDGAILQIDEVDSFLQDRRQAQRSWEVSQVNEFLTQLEGFDGIFVASSNLMDNLDQAALRRFDFKIRMDYLRPEQALAMLDWQLAALDIPGSQAVDRDRCRELSLAPGDFAVVARRHRVTAFRDASEVVAALAEEAGARARDRPRRIGFV